MVIGKCGRRDNRKKMRTIVVSERLRKKVCEELEETVMIVKGIYIKEGTIEDIVITVGGEVVGCARLGGWSSV